MRLSTGARLCFARAGAQRRSDRARKSALHGGAQAADDLRSRAGELSAAHGRLDVVRTFPVRVLSAGQRRRVAMARVLGMRAPLWLLDEPFTNLDAGGSETLRGPHCRACESRRHGARGRAP